MFGTDDITWCMSKCNQKKCRRNPANMINKNGVHSYAILKGTELCMLTKKKELKQEIKKEK